jgi:hypothetical protein
MENMFLPDESVDVIISNCMSNLSPDKVPSLAVLCRDYASADHVLEGEEAHFVAVGPDGPIEGEKAQALLAKASVPHNDLAQTVASVKVTAHKPA